MIYNLSKYNRNWTTKKLNQLGEFSRGKSKHRPRNDQKLFINGTYPLVQTGDIKHANLYITSHTQAYNDFGLQQSRLWDAGTLCITIAANIADTAILSYPACFPDSIVGFTAYRNVSSELFMHYVFEYVKKTIQRTVQGSIQDNINIDYLEHLNFQIPEKSYQDKVVHVLATIDKKMELNQKLNAELEAMAKTIYDYWFLQFEFPNEEGKPYKSSGGKMVYNEELKREIPEGWEVKRLYECMDVVYGFPLSTELFSENQGRNIIRIRDIPTNLTTIKSEEKVDDKYLSKCQDLLIGMDGNFHMNFWCNDGDIINQRITRIREINNNISALQVFFTIEPYIKALEKHVARSTVGHLSDKDIKSLKIIYPKDREKIYKILNKILGKICTNKSENQELTALRDFLLPLLMNGQVGFTEKTSE